jgi:hypothetical protein
MKKLILSLAILSTMIVACKKDESTPTPDPAGGGGGSTAITIEEKNRAAIIYFGEDWCPPCGTNGGPTLDSCLYNEGSLLTGLKINTSSNNTSLNWAVGNGMWNAYNSGVFSGASTIPAMAVNNAKQSISSSLSSNYSGVVQKANAFAATPVIAGLGLRKSIVGDSMTIETGVKFYDAIPAGSDYRLAVYVLEDDLVASQSVNGGTQANYVHHNVVRTCNASTYTGANINNSLAITADQRFDASYKVYLKPTWNKAKLKVVGIIWKMGANPATVVNSNVVL